MIKYYLILSLLLFSCAAQRESIFQNVPAEYPVLKQVLNNPDKYKAQILYTEIKADKKGNVVFKDHQCGLDDERYYYPASTVKLPVAVLAMEWLREQNIKGLDIQTVMLVDSVRPSQISHHVELTAENLKPSIGHHIQTILLVSDNEGYNKLYELLGQDYINEKLRAKGLNHTVINHRLSRPMSEEDNRYFNPIRFVQENGTLVLELPERKTSNIYKNEGQPTVGKGYYKSGVLVEEPMDFTYKNKFALSDFHGVLKRIIFPENFQESERFHISKEDQNFVLKHMSMLPVESKYPRYDTLEFYESYSKFYKFGTDKGKIPSQFRLFNKTGTAYGHLLDGGLMVDFERNVAFLVSGVIYVNENDILNDDTYEYETIGFPFFKELGDYLYELETRKKHKRPNLSGLKFNYN